MTREDELIGLQDAAVVVHDASLSACDEFFFEDIVSALMMRYGVSHNAAGNIIAQIAAAAVSFEVQRDMIVHRTLKRMINENLLSEPTTEQGVEGVEACSTVTTEGRPTPRGEEARPLRGPLSSLLPRRFGF